MVINVFLIPLVTVRGEGALFCWLFARFLSLGCRMPWAWRECTTRTTAKNFSSNTVRGKNFRTAPYYYKINLFPQWQCIVFVIVFSIQELNARCRMGLCGNFTLSESTRFHVFFFVVFVLFNVLLVVLLYFLIYMFVVFIYFVANSTEELEDIRVDSNINNVTVRRKFSCLQFMTTGTCD